MNIFTLILLFAAPIQSVQIALSNETLTEMLLCEVPAQQSKSSIKPFFIDKSPVTQKIFRAFDPTYIKRIDTICDECPVLDATDTEKESFCVWAGKRMPSAQELKTQNRTKEEGFWCAIDKEHPKASQKSTKIKPASKKTLLPNLFKGGTCDPVE